ncbi:glycerol-3-phosphate dehydrogenase/oxidase [Candidatus Hepatincolaceae symbiont of Richtersius coronifer]
MIKREEIISAVKSNPNFDVIIIGGGAVGLGAGVDASARGYKTLVIEKFDFAKGTSSRSTKLLHGGVRYLAQLNFHLVRDSLKEKERLYNNAPHLTKDCEFIIPCYSLFDLGFYRAGLFVYDVLAGYPKGHSSSFISKQQIIKRYPRIKQKGLIGGIIYHDGIFDDARLALSLADTISVNGSFALNYHEAVTLEKDNGKIIGVKIKNTETAEEYVIKSQCVLNATGIFSDEVRKLDTGEHKITVEKAQGVHIVVNKSCISSEQALLIPKTSDGRVLFTVPWHENVIIGTTDTLVSEATIEPVALEAEIDFIISNINKYLEKPIGKEDIQTVYAGIRPLIKEETTNTAKISREERTTISDSNLVSVIGGKWTSYRRMSEKVIDFMIGKKLLPDAPSKTKDLKLAGYLSRSEVNKIPEHLMVYGSNLAKLETKEGFSEKIHPLLPYNISQIVYAVESEQARTVDDVLARRTRALFLNSRYAVEAAPKVAEIMAKHLNKDITWQNQQVKEFTEIAKNYLSH